jgi:hypothetical protein
MASYASILSSSSAPLAPSSLAAVAQAKKPEASTVVSSSFTRGVETDLQKEIQSGLSFLRANGGTASDMLMMAIDKLRGDMEVPQGSHPPRHQGGRFGGGGGAGGGGASGAGGGGAGGAGGASGAAAGGHSSMRSFAQPQGWRSGSHFATPGAGQRQSNDSFSSTRPPIRPAAPSGPPRPNVGRYQSRFTSGGDLNDKILHSVIGNKLNAFTPLTYNDTRDFIYQIMDSGETEFIKDFIEKVFAKATVEELYCALFAKLIAEIAHKYPVMYDEMRRYHSEFLKVFDDVQEGEASSDKTIKQRLYRLGYGQFISELASLNAIEKGQLLAMVEKVMEKIWILTAQESKVKTVEEFIDCLVRLTKSLSGKSPKFFEEVKADIRARILENATGLIEKSAGPRPSLSSKARFGLMDLRDILK